MALNCRLAMTILAFLPALLAGCHLTGKHEPVPQSLSESRKLSRQGVAAMEQGQRQQAEELLAKAVAACPNDPEAHHNYAEILWQRGDRAKAVAQMEEAARGGGEDAAFWARLAEMYLALNNVQAADASARQALDIDPKLASAWAIRGAIMCKSGQTQQALADNLRSLRYAPGDRKVLMEVAELYRELNQPEQSLQSLQTVADSYAPGEEPQEVLYLSGLAYMALGRNSEAVESLSAAAVRGKPSSEILYRLAEAKLAMGCTDDAVAIARQALSIQPQHQASRELLQRIELARRTQDSGNTVR